MFSTILIQKINFKKWERRSEAPPTRAESLGHQPRQAAWYLGPGEVVVIEALDGRDDEGPSHPSVICRISHCFTVRDPLLYCCCWRLSQQEFLLTADNIPSRGIQCTKISFSQKTEKNQRGKKTQQLWPGFWEHDELEMKRRPSVHMSSILSVTFPW